MSKANQLEGLLMQMGAQIEDLRAELELLKNSEREEWMTEGGSGSDLPVTWRFSKTGDTTGTVVGGLLLVRNEVKTTAFITSWPTDGEITVGAAATHFWLEFTLDESSITCTWKSGTEFPDAEDGSGGTPTHNVPILSFTFADGEITGWTQHQCGNVYLQQL